MNGIEYTAFTDIYFKEEENAEISGIINKTKQKFKNEQTTIKSKQVLLKKLNGLKECPDYLLPTFFLSSGTGSCLSNINKNSNLSEHFSEHEKVESIYYKDDFILLSEFSEIEGPKPLITIPTDGGTGFNKKEYSLHLMCVDFHSHLQPHKLNETQSNFSENDDLEVLSQSSSSKSFSKFSLTKDTSIINYWETNSSVTTCVHHFTLYDLEARGFVRHFCLAYISYEKNKPIAFFERIRNRFTEITDLLKKSNFNLFKHELDQRCLDLKFTRNFFFKWSNGKTEVENSSSNFTDQDKLDYRLKLAKEHKIDNKTFDSLNASCSNEEMKMLQLNTIDNLLSEMENVLSVITNELKVKNWFIINNSEKVKSNLNSNFATDTIENDIDNISFAVDSKFKDCKKSSFTYRQFSSFGIREDSFYQPMLVKNVLIGNLSLSGLQNVNALIYFLNLENNDIPQQRNQPKTMKRFLQLCSDTAKQAINKLRLIQKDFSKPYHLLKYKELTTIKDEENVLNKKKHPNSYNLFWSITLGDCLVADFSTNIDTFNLNKYALVNKSNIYNQNVKITNSKKFKKNSFIINSPIKEENIIDQEKYLNFVNENLFETGFFSFENTSTSMNSNSELKKIISSEVDSSWKKVQHFLNFEDDENLELNENDEFYSDISNKTTDETQINANEQTLNQQLVSLNKQISNDGELNDYLNDENNKWNIEEYEDEENEEILKQPCSKEENEYDFANSLITLEYKPYNQYSTNIDFNGIYLSSSSLSLSLNSLSISIYYSTINRFKYQSNITDKLIQISEFNFEETLKKLLNNYATFFPHLLYSLLKGRPIICITRYCSELPYLTAVLDCLSNFIPNSFYCLNDLTSQSKVNTKNPNEKNEPKFTSSPCKQNSNIETSNEQSQPSLRPQLRAIYERKPIKLNDLKYCKLIGLNLLIPKDGVCCSADCNEKLLTGNTQPSFQNYPHKHKHYHQSKSQDTDSDLLLKYIPITIRNYVSIFDMDKNTFYGPKYKGHYLSNSLQKCRQLPQDSICYLYLLAHVVKFYVKVAFLYNYSILFDSGENIYNETKKRQRSYSNTYTTQKTSNKQQYRSERSDTNEDSIISSLSSKTVIESDQIKRERILRFYSSDYANNGTNSNNSLASSLSSIASAFIGDSNKAYKQVRRHSSQNGIEFEDIDLLRSILTNVTSINYNNFTISNDDESQTNLSTVSSAPLTGNSNNYNVNSSNFDDSDLNIVVYILKSLKIKQIFLYNLAMQKKKLKTLKKVIKELSDKTTSNTETISTEISNQSSSVISPSETLGVSQTQNKNDYLNLLKEQKLILIAQINSNIQLPLIIEYEESTLFQAKR